MLEPVRKVEENVMFSKLKFENAKIFLKLAKVNYGGR